ncbi:MAG TPA: hypothetical protein VKQ36_02780, partial [Ktedonobacterales bacterium]|nr:hypothetical protein [Ktedonobacterales bacterium]
DHVGANHIMPDAQDQAELRDWQAIAEATRALSTQDTTLTPSLALLEAVWARIDAEEAERMVLTSHAVKQAQEAQDSAGALSLARGWRLFVGQARVIHRSVWLASAVSIVCLTLYAAAARGTNGSTMLAAFIPLIAAAGAAFLYGREADPALELALATPSSPRLILLSRVGLILGFDLMLGLSATALAATLHGQSIGSVIALWLGPTALLSAGALLLSLLFGPLVASFSAFGFWLTQVITFDLSAGLQVALDLLWRTNPLTLLVAATLLIVAVAYAPRQERWA